MRVIRLLRAWLSRLGHSEFPDETRDRIISPFSFKFFNRKIAKTSDFKIESPTSFLANELIQSSTRVLSSEDLKS